MQLYRLLEMSDVFADACVRDASGNLALLSCYGRDTALTQLFAAFSLPVAEGGFSRISLEDDDGRVQDAWLSNAERFKKLAGRLPKENLFGNLAHVWVHDPVTLQADRAARRGWVLLDRVKSDGQVQHEIDRRIWAMFELLSPVPLLAHWQDAVREAVPEAVIDAAASTYPPLGRVSAWEVRLPEDLGARSSAPVKVR